MATSKDRDAFFTKSEIAKRFVDKVNEITPYDRFNNIIEPSAGSGRILQHLPSNAKGFDIEPMGSGIERADFLADTISIDKGSTIVVGNPPFGRQSKLAIEFFNKCAEFADVIAFIIPRSWMKYRTQNRLDKDFGLYYTAILPDNAFTLDGKDYSVRCCAQVWIRNSEVENYSYDGPAFESWNDKVSQEMLDDIDAYQKKHGCYEEC